MVYGYHFSQRRSKVPNTAQVDVASPCSSWDPGPSQGMWVQTSAQLLPQLHLHHAVHIPGGPATSPTQPAQNQSISLQSSLKPQQWPTPGPSRPAPARQVPGHTASVIRDLNVQPVNIALSVHSWPLNNCLQCPAARTASLLPARSICPPSPMLQRQQSKDPIAPLFVLQRFSSALNSQYCICPSYQELGSPGKRFMGRTTNPKLAEWNACHKNP